MLGLIVDVNEVVCGDPSCAPIDTVFTLIWQSGILYIIIFLLLLLVIVVVDIGIDLCKINNCFQF